ncbi:MAG: hypothetical protein IPO77_11190 [Acidobacteria bacterium]|nr:hypothetical protein [Acidobacteriota bacterium]
METRTGEDHPPRRRPAKPGGDDRKGHRTHRSLPAEFRFQSERCPLYRQPVDFVVFDGLNDDEENQVRNVVFVEIKTGMSVLTRREKLVRDAIKAGRVRSVEWVASRDLHQAVPGLFE